MPAQEPDLASVQHLVPGAPEQRQQLRWGNGVGMRDGLIQFVFVQAPHFPKHLLMHSVEHGAEVRRADLREQGKKTIAQRNSFLESVDDVSAQRVVTAPIGPLSLRMPVIESMVQLGTHGTHHRAQLVNMPRHSGVTAPGIDYVVWIRETNAGGNKPLRLADP